MNKGDDEPWMHGEEPWMHGFNSTGNREEDERLITFKKLNWEAHVWRTAVESLLTELMN